MCLFRARSWVPLVISQQFWEGIHWDSGAKPNQKDLGKVTLPLCTGRSRSIPTPLLLLCRAHKRHTVTADWVALGGFQGARLDVLPFLKATIQAWVSLPPTPSHFLLRQEVDQAISILYAIHRAWEAKVGCPRASPSLYFQVHSRAWMIEIMITTPSAGIRKMSPMVPNYKCCKVFKCAWQWETLAVIWVNSLTFMPQFFYLTLLSLLHVYLQPPFLFTCLFLLRSKLDLSLDFKNLSRLRSRQIQDDEHRPQVPGDPSTNKHEGKGL